MSPYTIYYSHLEVGGTYDAMTTDSTHCKICLLSTLTHIQKPICNQTPQTTHFSRLLLNYIVQVGNCMWFLSVQTI